MSAPDLPTVGAKSLKHCCLPFCPSCEGHSLPPVSLYPFLPSLVPQESRATLRHVGWVTLSSVSHRLLYRVIGVLGALEQNLQVPLRPGPRNSTASMPPHSIDQRKSQGQLRLKEKWKQTLPLSGKKLQSHCKDARVKKAGIIHAIFCNHLQIQMNQVDNYINASFNDFKFYKISILNMTQSESWILRCFIHVSLKMGDTFVSSIPTYAKLKQIPRLLLTILHLQPTHSMFSR